MKSHEIVLSATTHTPLFEIIQRVRSGRGGHYLTTTVRVSPDQTVHLATASKDLHIGEEGRLMLVRFIETGLKSRPGSSSLTISLEDGDVRKKISVMVQDGSDEKSAYLILS